MRSNWQEWVMGCQVSVHKCTRLQRLKSDPPVMRQSQQAMMPLK